MFLLGVDVFMIFPSLDGRCWQTLVLTNFPSPNGQSFQALVFESIT